MLPMLPPFIIEQIRKREEEERQRSQQPVLRLPLPEDTGTQHAQDERDSDERGVVIIDLLG
jgi:hypothetical protein